MIFIKKIGNAGLLLTGFLILANSIAAQQTMPSSSPEVKSEAKKEFVQTAENETPKTQKASLQNSATDETSQSSDETAQVANYYVNYLNEYRLGPEDVISVEVFGQPNYSKAGIAIPPTAKISYPLIPGGVFVGGKTIDQVSKEIAKKLDEYIIDPQVTVTLEKVGSARYAVMGDVVQPGVRLMTRRVTAMSALTEAGGVLPTGSRSRAVIYRNAGGSFMQIPVNLEAVMKGKANDVDIQPGDQIFIPGNRMKTFNNTL